MQVSVKESRMGRTSDPFRHDRSREEEGEKRTAAPAEREGGRESERGLVAHAQNRGDDGIAYSVPGLNDLRAQIS